MFLAGHRKIGRTWFVAGVVLPVRLDFQTMQIRYPVDLWKVVTDPICIPLIVRFWSWFPFAPSSKLRASPTLFCEAWPFCFPFLVSSTSTVARRRDIFLSTLVFKLCNHAVACGKGVGPLGTDARFGPRLCIDRFNPGCRTSFAVKEIN